MGSVIIFTYLCNFLLNTLMNSKIQYKNGLVCGGKEKKLSLFKWVMIKEHVPEIMISHGISRKWIGILIVRKEDTTKEVVRKNHFRFSSFGNFVMKTIYQRDTYIYNIVCKQIYTITMLRHSFLVSKLPNVSPPSLVIMESLDATVESFCRLISSHL